MTSPKFVLENKRSKLQIIEKYENVFFFFWVDRPWQTIINKFAHINGGVRV